MYESQSQTLQYIWKYQIEQNEEVLNNSSTRKNVYCWLIKVSSYPAKLISFNFQPLQVVARHREPQLHVTENYSYLFELRPNLRQIETNIDILTVISLPLTVV